MAISLTAQKFLEALGKHELERIVLKETAPAVRVDTGNAVLDECLTTAMAVTYRVEFAPRERDKLLIEAATGKADFMIIPEYNRQTYALGRECERLLNAYLKEYNQMQDKIRNLAGKKQDAQAALTRQAVVGKKNGNGGEHPADKTRKEQEAEGRARQERAIEDQIKSYERESADAETKLRQISISDTMQRVEVLTGALKARVPTAPWQELVRYGITPANVTQPVLCSIPDTLEFPEKVYDRLNISGVIPVQRAPALPSRRAAIVAGIAGLVSGIAISEGVRSLVRKPEHRPAEAGQPRQLMAGVDYLVQMVDNGTSMKAVIRNDETYEDYKVLISPARMRKGTKYTVTFAKDGKSVAYSMPDNIGQVELSLDGKTSIVALGWMGEDQSEVVLHVHEPLYTLQIRPCLSALDRLIPPLIFERRVFRDGKQIDYNRHETLEVPGDFYLQQGTEKSPKTKIVYSAYRAQVTPEELAELREMRMPRSTPVPEQPNRKPIILTERPLSLVFTGEAEFDPSKSHSVTNRSYIRLEPMK